MAAARATLVDRLRERARTLKRDTLTLYLACRDPRTPWYAKALAGFVVAYALSPIDLIPDFIPVFGYLDDLVLVPLGMSLAIRLVPEPVLADCRARAQAITERPTDRRAMFIIIAIWIAALAFVVWIVLDLIR